MYNVYVEVKNYNVNVDINFTGTFATTFVIGIDSIDLSIDDNQFRVVTLCVH